MKMLEICSEVFESYNKNNIRYCHWKSNEHLDAAVRGETDLDLLVDRTDESYAEKILSENGFKKLEASDYITHPSTKDYIGFDCSTGKLVHIHLHYQLPLGRSTKQYYVPWSDGILKNRVLSDKYDIYTTTPEQELFLLLVRESLKLSLFKSTSAIIKNQYLSEDMLKEYNYLMENCEKDEVIDVAAQHLSTRSLPTIERLLEDVTLTKIVKFKRQIKREISTYRSDPFIIDLMKQKGRISKQLLSQLFLNINKPYFIKRSLGTGGYVISIIGADGSGKSTSSQELDSWLNWKLSTRRVYMGSNDISSLFKIPLKLVEYSHSLILSNSSDKNNQSEEAENHHCDGFLEITFNSLHAMVSSYEKRKKLRNVRRTSNKGGVVITDRYPQNQFDNFNDGPQLQRFMNSNSILKKWLASFEREPYDRAMENQPDVVIKLQVDPETAHRRDPTISKDRAEEKSHSIQEMKFENSTVIDIDATKEKEKVIKNIKEKVWELL